MGLRQVEEEILACKRCPLHKTRTHAVPGEGGFRRKIMLIGEAPGKNEDLQGRPFVGKAGKLLDEALLSAGLTREDVYITNVLKCRPPNNRDPTEQEITTCSRFLDAQLHILKPKVVVALGRFAWAWLCDRFNLKYVPISEARGSIFPVSTLTISFKIIPTYHPAAVLRRRNLTETFFQDIKLAASVG